VFQAALAEPLWAIVGRELALAVGVIFGALMIALLKRSIDQTQRAESLLRDLQAANSELESAHRMEKALAIAEERVRLARDLHDSVAQSLYSVTLYAEAAADLLDSGDTTTAARHLRDVRDTAQESLREMRLLVFELHRPALDKGGLGGALQARLDAVETRGGIHSELKIEGVENVARMVQEELYSIAQEALNNALNHAHARNVRVFLRFTDAFAELEILDDGVGFKVSLDQQRGGFGILGMKERTQRIGGTFGITSEPGKGSKVSVLVPGVPSESAGHQNAGSPQKGSI
jgi:signal transduction histidine kinase